MKVLTGFLDLPLLPGPTVGTIGNFDGAHLGHQRIFTRVRERAAAGSPPIAVTFDPHPIKILRPEKAPRMILTREQKIEILDEQGFSAVVFIPFSREISEIEPEPFVELFLLGTLRLTELSIGVDFRFGRGRRGDLALLQRMFARRGGSASCVETVSHDGERISASRIREALAGGDVRNAAEMMGRPYELIGEVVRGAGRGRGQGAPTANLEVLNEMIPGSGVYLTETRVGETTHPSLTNIGTRPTFESAGFAVETWLPDFSGDLYGRTLRVRFHDRIRDEMKFPTPQALRDQIGKDLEEMREFYRTRRSKGGTSG